MKWTPIGETKFLTDFTESVKDNIIGALNHIEQHTANAQVGQPARQAANVKTATTMRDEGLGGDGGRASHAQLRKEQQHQRRRVRATFRTTGPTDIGRRNGTQKTGVDDRRCARGKLAAMCTKRGSPHRSGGAANERLESSSAPMPAGSEKKHATNSKRKRESMQ